MLPIVTKNSKKIKMATNSIYNQLGETNKQPPGTGQNGGQWFNTFFDSLPQPGAGPINEINQRLYGAKEAAFNFLNNNRVQPEMPIEDEEKKAEIKRKMKVNALGDAVGMLFGGALGAMGHSFAVPEDKEGPYLMKKIEGMDAAHQTAMEKYNDRIFEMKGDKWDAKAGFMVNEINNREEQIQLFNKTAEDRRVEQGRLGIRREELASSQLKEIRAQIDDFKEERGATQEKLLKLQRKRTELGVREEAIYNIENPTGPTYAAQMGYYDEDISKLKNDIAGYDNSLDGLHRMGSRILGVPFVPPVGLNGSGEGGEGGEGLEGSDEAAKRVDKIRTSFQRIFNPETNTFEEEISLTKEERVNKAQTEASIIIDEVREAWKGEDTQPTRFRTERKTASAKVRERLLADYDKLSSGSGTKGTVDNKIVLELLKYIANDSSIGDKLSSRANDVFEIINPPFVSQRAKFVKN